MYTTIQNNKNPAQVLNGRYYQTFTPLSSQELVKIHHMGCVGDTTIKHIQLEKGTKPTEYTEATETTPPLSGLFRDFRNLKLDLLNESSNLRASFQTSAKNQMVEYFDKNVSSKIEQSANKIQQTVSSLSDNAVMKNDIKITSQGIQLGAGKVVNGQTISSLFVTNPESIKAITKLMELSGNLLVNGSVTADKMAANSITAASMRAASVESKHLTSEAVESRHLKVDDALINKLVANKAFVSKLWAQEAFINNLKTVNFDFTRGTGDYIQSSNGNMKWDLNNNYLILKSSAAIEFKESSNLLFRRFNGQTAFLNFVNDTTGTESGVVLGGNRDDTFNPNDMTFVGMRVFPKTDLVSFLADKIDMSGGVGEKNGFFIDVLESKIYPKNKTNADIFIGSKSGRLYSLREIIANLIWNIMLLHQNKTNRNGYTYDLISLSDIGTK